jgi:adenine-specific DNA-methyltransferase
MKNNKQKTGDLGQHWTPHNTVERMCSLIENKGTILEPSVGSGNFLKALPKHTVGLEIDPNVVEFDNGNIVIGNFFSYPTENKFDTIIGNPPYVQGKLLNDDWFDGWSGVLPRTANAYLHFIEKCFHHLNYGGEMIFIIPSTIFSNTSLGNNLRDILYRSGAFTHVFYERTEWEKASVSTLYFRYVKGKKQEKVITDRGEKNLVFSNGFIWLIDYETEKTIGDFFKATVGGCPPSSDIGIKTENSFEYFKDGNMVYVDETNKEKWPRYRLTAEENKIFFSSGPTRKFPVFWTGSSKRHLNFALIPKIEMDLENAAEKLNEWFKESGESLGFIKDGRYAMGVKQIENIPLPKGFFSEKIQNLETFFG